MHRPTPNWSIQELTRGLNSHDPALRYACAEEIAERGMEARQALPVLLQALRDDDALVVEMAVQALGNMQAVAILAIPALIRVLRSEEHAVQVAAGDALVKMGKPAVPALIPLINDPSPSVQLIAIQCLGDLGRRSKEAVKYLKTHQQTDNPRIKRAVRQTLEAIGTPEALNVLAEMD